MNGAHNRGSLLALGIVMVGAFVLTGAGRPGDLAGFTLAPIPAAHLGELLRFRLGGISAAMLVVTFQAI